MLVHNKSNYSYEAEGVVLIPGANNVDQDGFKKFSAHPLMSKLIDAGEIVASEQKELNVKDAQTLIADTFDIETLEAMKVNEKRKTVIETIDKRIEELKNPEK